MGCCVFKVFALLLLFLATGKANSQESFYEYDLAGNPSDAPTNPMPTPIIKLAIVYDSEFGDRFGNDSKKIQEYWEVVMYDLHLRFQTLPSFVTSFQVTSLNLYEEPENQSFFERVRKNVNDLDAVSEISEDFQSWAYQQIDKIPTFDIAVLALGTPHNYLNFLKDKSSQDSVCRAKNDIDEKWMASTVISFQEFPTPPEILAVHIASILGAPSDLDSSTWNICNAYNNEEPFCCILGSQRPYPEVKPKFFSHCTDQFLSQKLTQLVSDNKFCLNGESAETDVIIDSAKLFETPSELHGYTMLEQCQLFNPNTQVEIKAGPNECVDVVCVAKTTNSKASSFTPLEGTICGADNKGRCFRGMCVDHRIQLVNVGTGKCLVSENSMFSKNDGPILQDCSQVVTQSLSGPGIKNCYDREELVLTFPYSTSHWISYKSLGTNLEVGGQVFCQIKSQNCRDTLLEIRRMNDADGQEFLIRLHGVMMYLKAADNGINLEVTNDGSGKDKATRWKLVELVKGAAEPHNCQKSNVQQEYHEKPVFELRQRIEL